jgi:hypothetical protein
MKLLLTENMKVNGLVVMKMLILEEKFLIEVEHYRNLNMNILKNLLDKVFILFLPILVEKVVILLQLF